MDLGVAWLIQNQILFATPQVYMSKLGFIFQPFYICTTPCIATTSQVKRHYKEDEGCTSGGPVAPSVQMGNLMATRCAILLLIATARSLFWVLEQPQSSLFEMHPMVQKVFALVPTFRKSIRMGDFGGLSLKPTWLYSGTWHLLINIVCVLYGSPMCCLSFMAPKGFNVCLAEQKNHPNESIHKRVYLTLWIPYKGFIKSDILFYGFKGFNVHR